MDSTILASALLGGLILNVMPCVLPVLTMKVFHLVEQTEMPAHERRMHAVAYGGGVWAMFLVFSAVVIAIRASGQLVGWGMQFSDPVFMAAITTTIYVFGLNALGVFEFYLSSSSRGPSAGYLASFWNGVLASIMATPCSAPFLGAAAGVALATGAAWWQTVVIFSLVALGLALPFLAISFVPALARLLPQPGPWMLSLKKIVGFSLIGAAVWLFGTLMRQIDLDSARQYLWFILILSVALWSLDEFGGLMHSAFRRLAVRFGAAAIVGVSGWSLLDLEPAAAAQTSVATGEWIESVVDGEINWQPFNSALVMEQLDAGRPVFMDYTADWCANCKTNERLFIDVDRIKATLSETQVLPMKADLTVDNDEILRWRAELPGSGIPVYVIYYPDRTFEFLPQAITTETLADGLMAAAQKFPVSRPGR